MIPKEIKKLIDLSGGKMIISEGKVEDSYIVIKLDEYLSDIESKKENDDVEVKKENVPRASFSKEIDVELSQDSLTNEELLDRINADIELLRQRNAELELEEAFADQHDELDYDYV